MSIEILQGDCLTVLASLPAESVHCCVTSPPYWGLRDYGVDGQLGCERTPDEYVAKLVALFEEVRRVLVDDGTLWLNLGDSYFGGGRGGNPAESAYRKQATNAGSLIATQDWKTIDGYKPKDLIGIPWMVAFALRSAGWWLRGDHVWGKPNGMPESVEDRPTRSHEYVFLLSKSARYYYDHEAVRTAPKASTITRLAQDVDAQQGSTRANGAMKAVRKTDKQRGHSRRHDGFNDRWDQMERDEQMANGANLRSVWWIPPAQCKAAHFAVMPERVAQICILAGCPEGGTVLDPFCGSGTTALVAQRNGCHCIGIELNPEYIKIAKARLRQGSLL